MLSTLEILWLGGGSGAIGCALWFAHLRTRQPRAALPAPAPPTLKTEDTSRPENGPGQGAHLKARYRTAALLSEWERRALLAFRAQLPTGFYLCPQVRLADLVEIVVDTRRFPEALNRVAGKSVDFVVIELATGRPALVIELDDKSHNEFHRQQRDRFVNELMEALSIPLRRFTPSMTLDLADVFPAKPSAPQEVFARPAR